MKGSTIDTVMHVNVYASTCTLVLFGNSILYKHKLPLNTTNILKKIDGILILTFMQMHMHARTVGQIILLFVWLLSVRNGDILFLLLVTLKLFKFYL